MRRMLVFAGFFLFSTHLFFAASQPWSVVYKKLYLTDERLHNGNKKDIFFKKEETIPFTQLIISWNAFMPQNGGFTFYVRVHLAKNSDLVWEPWHKAFVWTQETQRSFFSKAIHDVYHHVRLEVNDGAFADGFEVRVEATDYSVLEHFYALFICVSNYKEFKPELPYKAAVDLSTVMVENVQKKSQKHIDHPRMNALCSPTALSMLLEFLLNEPIDSLETARNVYDEGLDVFGSWPFNIAYAFERCHGHYYFYIARFSSFAQLYRMLTQGIPIAVSIRGNIKGGKKEYKNGHFVLVVGFDSVTQKVLCYDPAFEFLDKVAIWYDLEDFLIAWERSFRIAYLAHSLHK